MLKTVEKEIKCHLGGVSEAARGRSRTPEATRGRLRPQVHRAGTGPSTGEIFEHRGKLVPVLPARCTGGDIGSIIRYRDSGSAGYRSGRGWPRLWL